MYEKKSIKVLDILNVIYSLGDLVLTVAVIFVAFDSDTSLVALRVWTVIAACLACLAFVIAHMESIQPDAECSFRHQSRFIDALVNVGQALLLLICSICA